MADIYDNLQLTVRRLLIDKGVKVSFRRNVEKSFDPSTGIADDSEFVFYGYGVLLNYKSSEIDNELILKSDVKLLLEAVDHEPLVGDVVTANDVKYRVMAPNPTKPATTILKWDVQLRK